MLRSETLLPTRHRRPRLLLCAVLGLAGGVGAALLMDGGHPLPASRLTISRWALQDGVSRASLAELLGLSFAQLDVVRRTAAAQGGTAHLSAFVDGRTLRIDVE